MLRPSALIAVLAVLVVGCSGAPSGPQAGDGGTLEPLATLASGEEVASATLPRLVGEGEVRTDQLGRPAVINFWATWCTFCVDEMPDFERVHQDVGDEVLFVGVNLEDNLDKARRLATETGVTYELVVDADGSFFRAVEGRGMPTTLFVEADGTVAHRHAGPLDAERLRELVEEHLEV